MNLNVYANSYEEKKKNYVKSFESLRSKVSDAFENQNKTSYCVLLGDYEKTLKDGWYYLRESDFSFDELNKTKWFIYSSKKENCL